MGSTPKAGTASNHWFGCLRPEWLDRWGVEHGGEEKIQHWDRGVKLLGELSEQAVQACYLVWAEVLRLWAQDQRLQERSQQQRRPGCGEGAWDGDKDV